MNRLSTPAELRAAARSARADGASVGLVPTMGYLHHGHLSLIRAAADECDVVFATIFVNPLQFAPGEDLDSYPRDVERDATEAEEAGCDSLFVPSEDAMYPEPVATTVTVDGLGDHMEGASRRTHFAGVATVVTKLFAIVGECSAYFGEKDFQQLAIVRKLATDLSLPARVVGCPTVRESDGLAMSSRNAYLTDAERLAAPVLNEALRSGASLIAGGETDAALVKEHMERMVADVGVGTLDYFEIADSLTLEPTANATTDSRLFGAIQFGKARLIDNVGVTAESAQR